MGWGNIIIIIQRRIKEFAIRWRSLYRSLPPLLPPVSLPLRSRPPYTSWRV